MPPHTTPTTAPLSSGEVVVEISVSECAREAEDGVEVATDEVWYVVLQPWGLADGQYMDVLLTSGLDEKRFEATATQSGLVLSNQWNHFFLVSEVEGALTLIVQVFSSSSQ